MSEEADNQNEPLERIYTPEELAVASAGVVFMRSTPDYMPCTQNAERIQQYLDQMDWEPTAENMKRAFDALSEAGLMVARPKSKSQREREQRETDEAAALAEQEDQIRLAEQEELARRRELGSTAAGLKELAKITRAEVCARRKSSVDGLIHTAYPTSKINAKQRGFLK